MARLTAREKPRLCVVTEKILQETLTDPGWLRNSLRIVEVGVTLDPLAWVEELVKAGYRTVGTVTERGEVARRGGIVDVFSQHAAFPVRMEWGGDQLESIREIDLNEQTGIAELRSTEVFLGRLAGAPRSSSLSEYLGPGWGKLSTLSDGEEPRLEGNPIRHGFIGEPIREAGLAEARRRRVGAGIRSWLSLSVS